MCIISNSYPDLLYDWNQENSFLKYKRKAFVDETLRDGMQGASLKKKPNQKEKRAILKEVLALHPSEITLGFPAAEDDSLFLAQQAKELHPNGEYGLIARTVESDIRAVLKVRELTKLQNIHLNLFVGISPIRTSIERWKISELAANVEKMTSFACSGVTSRIISGADLL